jgi:hypothetical protein
MTYDLINHHELMVKVVKGAIQPDTLLARVIENTEEIHGNRLERKKKRRPASTWWGEDPT